MEKNLVDYILDEDFVKRKEDVNMLKTAQVNNSEVSELIQALEIDPMQKYAEERLLNAVNHDVLEAMDGSSDKTLQFIKLAHDRHFNEAEVVDFIIKRAEATYKTHISLIEKEVTDAFKKS